MVLRPVGSLPPGIYWRRRLVVLLVVVAVVLFGWWLAAGRGGGGDGAGATDSPSSSTTPSLTPSTTPTTASRTPSATGSPTTSAATASVPPCPDSAITVTVATDRQSYPPGVSPTLTLSVENVSARRCLRNVGQNALELTISTGTSQVWASDDCSPGGPSSIRELAPGVPYAVSVVWDRTLSQPGCPSGQPSASPGQYDVKGRAGTVLSDAVVFALT